MEELTLCQSIYLGHSEVTGYVVANFYQPKELKAMTRVTEAALVNTSLSSLFKVLLVVAMLLSPIYKRLQVSSIS